MTPTKRHLAASEGDSGSNTHEGLQKRPRKALSRCISGTTMTPIKRPLAATEADSDDDNIDKGLQKRPRKAQYRGLIGETMTPTKRQLAAIEDDNVDDDDNNINEGPTKRPRKAPTRAETELALKYAMERAGDRFLDAVEKWNNSRGISERKEPKESKADEADASPEEDEATKRIRYRRRLAQITPNHRVRVKCRHHSIQAGKVLPTPLDAIPEDKRTDLQIMQATDAERRRLIQNHPDRMSHLNAPQQAVSMFENVWQESAEVRINRLRRNEIDHCYDAVAYDVIAQVLQPLVKDSRNVAEKQEEEKQLNQLILEMDRANFSDASYPEVFSPEPHELVSKSKNREAVHDTKIRQYFYKTRANMAFTYFREEIISFVSKILTPKFMQYETSNNCYIRDDKQWHGLFEKMLNENNFMAKIIFMSGRIIHKVDEHELYKLIFAEYKGKCLRLMEENLAMEQILLLSKPQLTTLLFKVSHRLTHTCMVTKKVERPAVQRIYQDVFDEIMMLADFSEEQKVFYKMSQMDDGIESTDVHCPVKPSWNYEMRRVNHQYILFHWLQSYYSENCCQFFLAAVALLQSVRTMESMRDNCGMNPNLELHQECFPPMQDEYWECLAENLTSKEANAMVLMKILERHKELLTKFYRDRMSEEDMFEIVTDEIEIFYENFTETMTSVNLFETIINVVARVKQRFYTWAYNIKMTAEAYDADKVYPKEYLQDVNPWPYDDSTRRRLKTRAADTSPLSIYKHGRPKTSDRRTPLEYRLPATFKTDAFVTEMPKVEEEEISQANLSDSESDMFGSDVD